MLSLPSACFFSPTSRDDYNRINVQLLSETTFRVDNVRKYFRRCVARGHSFISAHLSFTALMFYFPIFYNAFVSLNAIRFVLQLYAQMDCWVGDQSLIETVNYPMVTVIRIIILW